MPRIVIRLEIDRTHVFRVGSLRFSIYRAFVQFRIFAGGGIYREDVNNWHLFVEDFRPTLDEFACFSVERRTLEKQAVDVNSFLWLIFNILLVITRYHILQDYRIQSPTLVRPGHFLKFINVNLCM